MRASAIQAAPLGRLNRKECMVRRTGCLSPHHGFTLLTRREGSLPPISSFRSCHLGGAVSLLKTLTVELLPPPGMGLVESGPRNFFSELGASRNRNEAHGQPGHKTVTISCARPFFDALILHLLENISQSVKPGIAETRREKTDGYVGRDWPREAAGC